MVTSDIRMVVQYHFAWESLVGLASDLEVTWCRKQCFIALTASSERVPIVAPRVARRDSHFLNMPSLHRQEVAVEAVRRGGKPQERMCASKLVRASV